MAYNHFRLKDLYRRRYVFTKTKAFFAFVLSVFFSVILSAFFDRHGDTLFKQVRRLAVDAHADLTRPRSDVPKTPQKPPADLREKLQELTRPAGGALQHK